MERFSASNILKKFPDNSLKILETGCENFEEVLKIFIQIIYEILSRFQENFLNFEVNFMKVCERIREKYVVSNFGSILKKEKFYMRFLEKKGLRKKLRKCCGNFEEILRYYEKTFNKFP